MSERSRRRWDGYQANGGERRMAGRRLREGRFSQLLKKARLAGNNFLEEACAKNQVRYLFVGR